MFWLTRSAFLCLFSIADVEETTGRLVRRTKSEICGAQSLHGNISGSHYRAVGENCSYSEIATRAF